MAKMINLFLVNVPTSSDSLRMSASPKVSVILPPALLNFYQAKARNEERSLSATLARELRIASGLPSDPEADAKSKTPSLKGL